ncbi:MAG: 3-deoxy-D-manno-octulosonic acid transferase [Mariprofundales bacterium]
MSIDLLHNQRWRQSLGLDMPQCNNSFIPVIWLHACSVGEINAVAPLIRQLLQRKHKLHLTLVTETGMAQAQRLFAQYDDNHIGYSFLPLDFPFAFHRFVRKLKPHLLLLTETEFWPGMLAACHRQKIAIVGINSRVSDRSLPRYKRTCWLWQRWLKPVQLFLAQSELDAQRLHMIGVEKTRIKIAGNLKYAIQAPNISDTIMNNSRSNQRTIIIAASTHEGEEKIILAALAHWQKVCADVLLVLVPRHPQRFDAVRTLVKERGFGLDCWSMGINITTCATNTDVLLIDAMGVLPSLYPIADVVFIGGTLVDIGGHNPLEAAICGLSVCTGKYVQNFRDIMQKMQHQKAAYIADDGLAIEQHIAHLLQDTSYRQQLNSYAIEFMQAEHDVLDYYLTELEKWLTGYNRE